MNLNKTKHGLKTDGLTNGPTNPLIEMGEGRMGVRVDWYSFWKAWDNCERDFTGIDARKKNGLRTDGPTDGPTDRRTHPLIEMR